MASVVWPHRLQHPHPHHRASVHPGSFHCPLQTSSGAVIKTTLHEPIRSESSACITSLPRACEQSRTSCGEAGTQVPPSLNLQPWPLQEWERQALPPQENGSPLQYSGLGNPMDRGAWWATAHGVAKSRTQLSDGVFPSSGKFSASAGCSVSFFCREHIIKHRSIWVTEGPVTVRLTWQREHLANGKRCQPRL